MLRVWLPLNGDLHNQGCSNASITNTSAVINTAGKIGSCYSFGTAKSYLKFDNMDFIHNFTECSVSLWIKILSWNTSYATYFQFGLGSTPWAHYIFGLLRNSSASTLCFTISNGSSATNAGCLTPALELNTWYHLTLTYTAGHCKIYVNGIQTNDYSTTIVPNFAGITTGTIGVANNLTGYQTNCLINDFRIYDHCLSAAEVREISQGLVLHYKLDGVNNASVLPSQYQQLEYIESAGTSYFNTGYKFNAEIDSCKVIFKGNDTSNNGMIFASSGTKYFWFYYYGSSGIRIYAHNGSNGQKGIAGISSDLNQHTMEFKNKTYYIDDVNKGSLTDAYTDTTNNIWLFSYNNSGYPFKGRIYYVEIKKNNQYQRIFIPAKRLNDSAIGMYDLITNTFYTSSNVAFTAGTPVGTLTIEDSSGYNHNGTINGNIAISSDTNRYNYSAQFDGVDDSITVPYNTICPENIFTLNLWFKKDALGSKNYETLFGGPSGFEMDTRSGSATALSLYMASTRSGKRNLVTGLSLGNWYMITMTRDGTKEKYYVNGIFQSEIDAKSMPNGTYRIGAWASNTGQNYYGLISDFRIYCTALDADVIRQLYEVGAKVDNKGNLHTFELLESNNGRELLAVPLTTSYGNHINIYTNYDVNGEITLTGGSSIGSYYIPINPSGKTYYYDIEISTDSGNVFYIGFQRYDANKTARSNDATVYLPGLSGSNEARTHKHYHGTVDLSTDGVNPCAFTSLRILNDWSGANNRHATIHKISLREVSTLQNTKINKQGKVITTELIEMNDKFRVHKNGIIETNEIIEL